MFEIMRINRTNLYEKSNILRRPCYWNGTLHDGQFEKWTLISYAGIEDSLIGASIAQL